MKYTLVKSLLFVTVVTVSICSPIESPNEPPNQSSNQSKNNINSNTLKAIDSTKAIDDNHSELDNRKGI
jgi:hypothetical protein